MTFPVIFVMISSHYPSTYGHQLNWLVLAVLMVGSAAIRHFMNIRFSYASWLRGAVAAGLLAIAVVFGLLVQARGASGSASTPVAFAEARGIIERRCVFCHAAKPQDERFPAPPLGLMLTTPEQMISRVEKMRLQLSTNVMPLANKTNMTPEERAILIRWIDEGAHIDR
jgi:uncharacterized membrane protein